MEDKSQIPMTSAEMGILWTQYINDTASICMIKHFLKKVKDDEVRPAIEFALNGSQQNIDIFRFR
jgi:hypothetical protein